MILKDEMFVTALLEDEHIKLTPEISKILLPELEEKAMYLIQEAKKIMRHSKRKVLKSMDIELALKQIEHSHINQVFGSYPYEYEKHTHEDSTQWVLKNEDINLSQFLHKPITEMPLKPSIQMHWALLDGKVPLIAENIPPPKEKKALKIKEVDPLTVILKPKEQISKKKVKMEHKKEIAITQEIKEFFSKFLEIYNIEENDNRHSAELRMCNNISKQFDMYIKLIQKEPSIEPVIPAIVDFIYNKCIDYVTNKQEGDAKMLLICMRIIKCLLSNEYYN